MKIGDLIRLKRKSHRLTQKELGKMLNSSSRTVCLLEKNPRAILKFKYDNLKRISDILDIDIDLLIEECEKLKKK